MYLRSWHGVFGHPVLRLRKETHGTQCLQQSRILLSDCFYEAHLRLKGLPHIFRPLLLGPHFPDDFPGYNPHDEQAGNVFALRHARELGYQGQAQQP